MSTRFSGTDGVSLESNKWAENFEFLGHQVFWFAGQIDREPDKSLIAPEAHFQHPSIQWINKRIWGIPNRNSSVTRRIHELRLRLKRQLYRFLVKFGIDVLILENALTIPMNIPLGLALTEMIAEAQVSAVAHHHDFFWERDRFSVNSVHDYLGTAFPPRIPRINHVVINSAAQEQLSLRTGISSRIVPNVLDFENPPVSDMSRKASFKRNIGLAGDDIIILQPTRIIQRKGIERTIDLIKALGDPKYKLVLSHEAGDEGLEYLNWLQEYAGCHGVDFKIVSACIDDPWRFRNETESRYSLWDLYAYADLVTYPSLNEGFGNALLEGIYFKKPILVNRYTTFIRDIEPLGFELLTMNGFLSRKTVDAVKEIMAYPLRKEDMIRKNYETALHHYSYSVLRAHLQSILTNLDHQAGTRLLRGDKSAVMVDIFSKDRGAGGADRPESRQDPEEPDLPLSAADYSG